MSDLILTVIAWAALALMLLACLGVLALPLHLWLLSAMDRQIKNLRGG
ncbi:hypothetical protein [Ottowia sp.]